MSFRDYRIGTRLGSSIGVILIFMAGMVGVGVWGLQQMNKADNELNRLLVAARMAEEWKGNLHTYNEMTSAFLLNPGADEEKRIEDSQKILTQRITQIRDHLFAQASDLGKQLLNEISRHRGKYIQARDRVFDAKKSNGDVDSVVADELRPAAQAYISSIENYADAAAKLADEANDTVTNLYESLRILLIGAGLAALFLGSLLGWLATRSITRPIAHAVKIARTVASGDLSQHIEASSKDETGQLLAALHDMNANLARTVASIRTGTETISSASGQIAAGNTDLSSRTEEQAASLQETAASMEELAATVKQNSENARQANGLAIAASEVAERGGKAVSEVVGTMNAISSSSSKISEIVSVIDGIAFQTNILALNAAVEAARAGEQGKGFAVVAGEVRSLAQRSASAAKEVKDLIEDSVQKVNVGARQVESAGATMQEIVGSVKRVTDIMGEISSASEEQASGIGQVNQAVAQMDQVTQQNAALVEEAAAASASLQEQAAELLDSVSAFKVRDAQHTVAVRDAPHGRAAGSVALLPA